MKQGRLATSCLLVFLALAMLSRSPILPFPHSVVAEPLSLVYVTPVRNCCILPNASSPVFTVNVMMNLASSQTINGFDVRLNYTNFYSPTPPPHGVVKAFSLDYSNNIFETQFGSSQVYTQASCIDDVTYGTNGFCASDDKTGGQVHLAQTVLGGNMTGPVTNALLFSVSFAINATGTSLLYIERAHLSDPGGIPPNPHFTPVTTSAAVFGNDPIVAFFDFQSTQSPSVLSGISANFNASDSFRSSSSGQTPLSSPTFKWNFGDGTSVLPSTNPFLVHTFPRAGNFTVRLNVTDMIPGMGSFERVVEVVPDLGSLEIQVKNQNGGILSTPVTVKLYNVTSPVPTVCCNRTASIGGFADFVGLSPGSYSMNFTGAGIISSGKLTTVRVGEQTMETVYLTEITPPGPNTTALLIFVLVIGVGLSFAALALFVRWRRIKRLSSVEKEARKMRGPGRSGRP